VLFDGGFTVAVVAIWLSADQGFAQIPRPKKTPAAGRFSSGFSFLVDHFIAPHFRRWGNAVFFVWWGAVRARLR